MAPTETDTPATFTSNTNPHVRDKNSPLSALIMQALRRYGDFHPGTVDGDVMLMMLEFANTIIDDIRQHPYHDIDYPLDYYESVEEVRDIPDPILVNGLLYHYALQQGSDKLQMYLPMYYQTMNRLLWQAKNGNTEIKMRVMDEGTNKRNLNGGTTSTFNGTVKP